MSGLSRERRVWMVGSFKMYTIWFFGAYAFSVIIATAIGAQGGPITAVDVGIAAAMGTFIGLALIMVANRVVRKNRDCPKIGCRGGMVKILATGKYICQVCGGEVNDPKN